MIHFERHILQNGLKVIVHRDASSPLAAFNLLYGVGSRNEHPDHTGFAHLFEHLMFGGSKNIPSFDEPLQLVGGENNAFTSNDITNYYITVPSDNLETAFWLESDRMLELDFSERSLEVQRQVVVEEFRQRYLNQPYGDAFLMLRPMAYLVHPYRWAVIGKSEKHIMQANLDEVKAFFYRYYVPENAILTVTGNVDSEKVFDMAEKWFGPIPRGVSKYSALPQEPVQTESRFYKTNRDVPADRIYKVFHMPGRTDPEYFACDMISDILSNGKSSRLYRRLMKEQAVFSDVNAFLTGDADPGLLVITGTVSKGMSVERAEDALTHELEQIKFEDIKECETDKLKNKFESSALMDRTSILSKAMHLSYFEWLGSADDINREVALYLKTSPEDLRVAANKVLSPDNASTIHYLSNN